MNFARLRMRLGTGARREGLGIAAIKFASMPLGIAVAILLARSLGTDHYGRYAFALSLASSVALLTGGGFSQLLIREIAIARLQRHGVYYAAYCSHLGESAWRSPPLPWLWGICVFVGLTFRSRAST